MLTPHTYPADKPLIISPLQVGEALAAFYERDYKTAFRMDGAELFADEVFDPAGFLPVFAHIAEARSRALFDRSLMPTITPFPGGMFNVAVRFPDNSDLLSVMLVLRVSEDLLQPVPGGTIELLPLYTYFHTPIDQREKMPWPPGKRT